MRLNANQLAGHLKNSLAPVYLFAGDEPLLVGECCAAVRAAAVARGYAERQTLTVEPGFDWNSFRQSLSSLSLFSEKRVVEVRLSASKPGDTGAQMLLQVA
ncbi:MAG: DNA polymerase III subunit delta, partial [Acidiferrobacterales bacterium]